MINWISSLWARMRNPFRHDSAAAIDPEVREIFLSELDEVAANLAALLPKWRAQRTNPAILQEIRRGFHTLKGSGLAVGANELGKFCGGIEKLMLGLIERPNQSASEPVAAVEHAIGLLPACAEALRSGRPMPAALRAPARSAQGE